MKRSVLVTGASRGIGRAMAAAFARVGFRVCIHFHKSEAAARALERELLDEGCDVFCLQADVSDAGEVEELFRAAGRVDLLINNAGISQEMQFLDMTEEDWDRMMAVNLKSVFLCSRAAAGAMVRRKSGMIINISSMWGVTGGSCEVHYSAAKAGVIGFTKALAKELGPSGVQVNCIAPGVVNTDMNRGFSQADMAALRDQTPLERFGEPEDIARAALFLADDRFITGEVLNINGGFVI
ncbi:MAG: 3-oxoacyl-ACP reductase FabG [Oscillospiraceae bacterium]|nr:3-oxoacyl-ACP reductase FabG [Oscillospiraceae bacterium]